MLGRVWAGGPPPLEVGETMIVADSVTEFVGVAVRARRVCNQARVIVSPMSKGHGPVRLRVYSI